MPEYQPILSCNRFTASLPVDMHPFHVCDERLFAESIMPTFLARHSYGRISLHIVAMVIDRQVRWHCGGIAREVMS
jgi:hypothetical protein